MTRPHPHPHIPAVLIACTTALTLGGCASTLTGVGGSERFACQAPVGAQCTSISGVYANAGGTHPGHLAAHHAPAPSPLPVGFALPARTPPPAHTTAQATRLAALEPVEAAMPAGPATPGGASTPVRGAAPSASLRAPARLLRLWIAPWEDSDGDLHEASLLHVVVDAGRWLIERVRPATPSRLDIARPPATLPTPSRPSPQAPPAGDIPSSEP